ncbi:MAG: winged helix-turn-helix domain-containing protein [Gemmatimonadetes bacterium]|nr:winged helix-turn-helix domain-containing protein [Gemmatimonadota bacterium]
MAYRVANIGALAEREFGVRDSLSGMRKLLHGLGPSWLQPRPRLSLQFIPSGLPTGPGFGLPHFILFTDWASDPFGSRPRASVYHSLPAEHGAGAC